MVSSAGQGLFGVAHETAKLLWKLSYRDAAFDPVHVGTDTSYQITPLIEYLMVCLV